MSDHLQRAQKILQRINELAAISEMKDCITRTYGTKAFIEGRNKVEEWMKAAGLQTRTDTIGNIRGKLLSQNADAKTFVIASHIDTVINAGKFDGPLGVLMGLDIAEQASHLKKEIPFHIELIGFCDEEGCRFHTTYLGSRAVAGSFEKGLADKKDAEGVSLEKVIAQNGGDVNNLSKDAIAKKDWLGYFEIHIEQGPVLYERNISVGIVTAIAGQCRIEIIFKGEAGHAGTVPMNMRKDALAAAAEFILETEKFAKTRKQNLVATIGKLNITNPASNVIPGEVICSLDIRNADETVLLSSCDSIQKIAGDICKRRNIDLKWNFIQQAKPVTCDAEMNGLLRQSIKESGFELVELVSGAGHDAVPVSEVSPVAMLFVRCFKGISHNPLEDVAIKDMAAAIKVSDNFIERLINNNATDFSN
jgi:hydantoinase/carbamoylase family amidase